MFIGRIGSLTLLIALRKRNEKQEFFLSSRTYHDQLIKV
jgi:Trk-type K+ transport system membrane component